MKKFILSPDDIQAMSGFLHDYGLEMLKKDGKVGGLMHAYTGTGEQMMIPLLYRDNREKQAIYRQIKRAFVAKGVVCFFMLTEAWTVGAHQENISEVERLKQFTARHSLQDHPERQEVLIIQFVSYDEVRMTQYPMLRDEQGVFTGLGEPNTMSSLDEGAERPDGAIVHLLPEPEDFPITADTPIH